MPHLVLIASWLFSLPKVNRRIPFIMFTFAFLFLFLALRYDYGNDYMAYYSIHQSLQQGLPAWGDGDILFKWLNILVRDFHLLIMVTSSFYILAIYFLLNSNLPLRDIWFGLLVLLFNPYLFLIHLSSIRQTIAICILIFAIKFLIERKLLVFAILVLAAAGFHASAIVMLPFYVLLNQKKMKLVWIAVYLAVLVTLLVTPLFDWLASRIIIYFPQYQHYLTQDSTVSLRSALITSVILLAVLLNINKMEGKEIIFGKLALVALALSILSYKLTMLARIGMYFDIFLVVALPMLCRRIDNRIYRMSTYGLIAAIYLLRYYSFFTNPMWSQHYRSYRTIFTVLLTGIGGG